VNVPGLIPLAILGYGVLAGKKWALVVGGLWTAVDLVYILSSKKPAGAISV
jgi:hypothetical protein